MKNWTWKNWWNKDTQGVAKFLFILLLFAFLGWTLFGCESVTGAGFKPMIKAGLGNEWGDAVVGKDPAGIVSIELPLIAHRNACVPVPVLSIQQLHISSIPDYYDTNTIDQTNLIFTVPLFPFNK